MSCFRTAPVIDCEREDLVDELKTIVNVAKKQNRDFTDEEAQRIDEIQGPDGNGGLLAELDREYNRVTAANNAAMARAKSLFEAGVIGPGASGREMLADGRGTRFAILNKDDKATDFYPAKCENGFGHYVAAKVFGAGRHTPDAIRNTLSEGDNTLGGFVVPDPMMGEVIDLARAKSVLNAAGIRTVMMDSDSLRVPKLESDVSVATKSENAPIVDSDVTFGNRNLVTHTAAAMVKVSRELFEDSPTLLAEQLDNWMSRAMAVQIDKWGIQGTGSAEPLGLINVDDIDSTGSVGAIDWTDVSAAATSVRVHNHEPKAVILHPTIHADLMESTTGDGTNAASMWKGYPPTLEGISFHPTTNCPLANVIVGDFSKFLMGVRVGARVEASYDAGTAFQNHQIWVKIISRFDFVTLDDSAFYMLEGVTS